MTFQSDKLAGVGRVRAVRSPVAPGDQDWLSEPGKLERKTIRKLTVDKNFMKITVNGVKPAIVPKIMRLLAASGINYSHETELSAGAFIILSFAIPSREYWRTAGILDRYKTLAHSGDVLAETDLAMLSVIGSGAAYDSRIIALFYDVLLEKSVEIHLISLSEMKITALVGGRAAEHAISALRAKFREAGVYGPPERTVSGYEEKEDIHGLRGGCHHPVYS